MKVHAQVNNIITTKRYYLFYLIPSIWFEIDKQIPKFIDISIGIEWLIFSGHVSFEFYTG